ncbi:MAG TPA: hypothetical protein VHC69_13545 [Polyangiaceae bacterium]|nr:hypothetical protein [Polyangiaceae bacterium]
MCRGGGKKRVYAAVVALLLTGCDLNPRPEDPGTSDKASGPGLTPGTGGTTGSRTPSSPTSNTGGGPGFGDMGAGGRGAPESAPDAAARQRDGGYDAGANPSDAGADAGDAATGR